MGMQCYGYLGYGFTFDKEPDGIDDNDEMWDNPLVMIDLSGREPTTWPYIFVKESCYESYLANLTEIDPQFLINAPTEKWDKILYDYCQKYNLPYKQPKWYLTSQYT